jgi:hypothetical protein
MSDFYEFLKTTRQAHQQARKRNQEQLAIFDRIRIFIQAQRVAHGGGGLKKLYHQMPEKPVGRDILLSMPPKLD